MFRLLRAFLAFRKLYPKGNPPDWTVADAKGLEVFLASHTGRKLLAQANAQCGSLNLEAVYSRGNAFEAGTAFGFGAVVTWLFRLSSAQQGHSPSPDEVADDLEHLYP